MPNDTVSSCGGKREKTGAKMLTSNLKQCPTASFQVARDEEESGERERTGAGMLTSNVTTKTALKASRDSENLNETARPRL